MGNPREEIEAYFAQLEGEERDALMPVQTAEELAAELAADIEPAEPLEPVEQEDQETPNQPDQAQTQIEQARQILAQERALAVQLTPAELIQRRSDACYAAMELKGQKGSQEDPLRDSLRGLAEAITAMQVSMRTSPLEITIALRGHETHASSYNQVISQLPGKNLALKTGTLLKFIGLYQEVVVEKCIDPRNLHAATQPPRRDSGIHRAYFPQ